MLSRLPIRLTRDGLSALPLAGTLFALTVALTFTLWHIAANQGAPEVPGPVWPAPLPWLGAMLAIATSSALLALAWLRGNNTPPADDGTPTAPRYAMRTLLLALTASAALPLAMLLGYHMQREAGLEVDKARQFVSSLADITVADTAAVIAETERIVQSLAERPMVRSLDPERCDPLLAELVKINRHFSSLDTVDAGGKPVCSTQRAPANNRERPAIPARWQDPRSADALYISGPQKDAYSGRWFVAIAYPVRNASETVIGAARVVLDLEALRPMVKAALPDGGVVGLMDGKGVVIARSGPTPAEPGRDISGTNIGRAILAREQHSEILVGNDGVERYYAYRKIERSGWYAIVGVPTELIYADARRSANLNLLVGIAVVLFSGLLVYAIHRRIVAPLAALRDTARTIAGGDRHRRAPVNGPAEIAEVATTFNRMMDLIPRIEGALQVSEDHYRLLFESSPDAIRVVCDNRIVMLNPAAVSLYGATSKEEMLGRNVVDTMHPDYHDRVRERMRVVLEERRVLPRDEQLLIRNDGSHCWIDTIVLPFTYRGKPALLSIARDLSERKRGEERVQRLTELRLTVGKVNEAITRERDWRSLCESATRIVVEQGGLASALIRMHDPAADTLIPWAGFGPRTGRLGLETIAASDQDAPPALAFSSRRRLVLNRMDNAAIDATARSDALAQGIGSAGVFPMLWEGEAIGTLAVFADKPEVFDDEFAGLLEEIAANLAFANAKYKTDQALAESNERLAGMVASAMDAIITVNAAMHIAVFNRAAESMFGIQASDAIGMPLEDLMPSRYRGEHAGWMRAYATAGTTTRSMGRPGKVMARRADGAEFPVEASISHTHSGPHILYTVIMRDVTERLATERSLADAERRYRSLVENSPGGVALMDHDLIEYANPGLIRMFGFDKSVDIVGTSVYALLSPAFHGRVRSNLDHLSRAAGQTVPNGRLRMMRRDGGVIDVEAAATSIDLGGRTLVQVEMRDVTRELHALAEIHSLNRSLEARIEARTSELTRANRELESFAYSIAHDLRGPLRSMTGFAQLLAMDLREGQLEQVPQHVERIVNGADRMNELVDGLLRVARASHVALARQPVDMASMVASVVTELNIDGVTQIDVDALPTVLGDPVALRQVWVNLISNALKYSARRETPKIAVEYRIVDAEAIFSVSDNGIGFDAAFADKLFGVFQRLHAAADFEGNGVGLAIVRRIVERHDGRVWAEGKVGSGATFHFGLPLARLAQE